MKFQFIEEAIKLSVIEIINKRHSYRGKYKSDTVPREDLITIMKAGLNAPSGCNKQTTSLIAVDDKDVLKKLHKVINPPVGETAPAIICVLTQRINAYRDDDFELVCFLPVGIAETESTLPQKRAFEERAWFNSFPNIKREF